MGERRLRFTDNQRRRLAEKVKRLGRRVLNEIDTLITPDTLMAWHRKLIAMKWNHVDTYTRPQGNSIAMAGPLLSPHTSAPVQHRATARGAGWIWYR